MLTVACGQARTSGTTTPASSTSTPTAADSHRSSGAIGGTSSERDLLDQILAGVDSWAIKSAEIESSPPPDFEGTVSAPDWLQVNVPFAQTTSEISRFSEAQWETMLVAGAYRDLTVANSLPSTDGYTLGYLDDKGTVGGDQSATRIGGDPSHDIPTEPEDTVQQQIIAGLKEVGLTPDSVSFLHPHKIAPVAFATTEDAKAFADKVQTGGVTADGIFGRLTNYEGVYLEVDDSTGAPVVIFSTSTRANQGLTWYRPDLGLGGGASP
jgi:hypothetical protein